MGGASTDGEGAPQRKVRPDGSARMRPHGGYKQLDPPEEPRPPPPKRPLLGAFLLFLLFLLLLLLLLLLRPRPDPARDPPPEPQPCTDPCRIVLVESIPEGMPSGSGPAANPSTFSAWLGLVAAATESLDVASFYWTLTNEDTATHEPSAAPGERVLAELLRLPRRGVSVRVAVNVPSAATPVADLRALESSGASVRAVDLPRLTGGVLHTKLWVVDRRHLYLGSANMDWRALTQVKELGAAIYNCSCLARDAAKIFEAYWALGVPGASIPAPWPAPFATPFNRQTPLALTLNGSDARVYLSSSPPALCAEGRTPDLEALLSVIDGAAAFVDVSVMSYLPGTEFSRPERFWPAIDERLRRAAVERGVAVRVLAGCWRHSRPQMFPFLRSLAALNGTRFRLEVRLFLVPEDPPQSRIPFARVNHNKYMVTDRAAYVGTSNWSGDYFERTGGSALVLAQPGGGSGTFRDRLRAVFQRDWGSPHSVDIGDPRGWAGRCGPA